MMKILQETKRLLFAMMLFAAFLFVAMPIQAATSNPSPASPGYIVMPLSLDRQITATATPIKFKLPFPCEVVSISVCAVTIDKTTGDETYTVDVKEGGTSILDSAVSVTTAGTIYDATVDDTTLADESTITVTFTLAGTTPILTDANIVMVLKRQ